MKKLSRGEEEGRKHEKQHALSSDNCRYEQFGAFTLTVKRS